MIGVLANWIEKGYFLCRLSTSTCWWMFDENYVHDVVRRLKCFYFASMLPRLADDFKSGRLKLTKRYKDIFSK